MLEYICVGADVHDRSILIKWALGLGKPEVRSFANTPEGRVAMIRVLQRRSHAAGGAEIVLAYEAAGQGFGLYDELTAAGIRCHVLAPSRIAHSCRHKRDKTDERDAELLLELVRGHVLAGNSLPAVWVPAPQTRDDREVVRARLDTGERLAKIKTQVRCLLKRNQVRRPDELGEGWTAEYQAWLQGLARPAPGGKAILGTGGQAALGVLLHQMGALEEELGGLDRAIAQLARTPRYARPAASLDEFKGVGMLTAMVFLTEMGDLSRFHNRRQVACYLGLVPSKAESGENNDHKGHITHQGPGRVRKVLCQASWASLGHDPAATACYQRIVRKNPKHKKIAAVALMRRLGVRLWHRGLESQRAEPGPQARQRCRRPTGPHRSAAAATSDELSGPILDRRRSERGGPAL